MKELVLLSLVVLFTGSCEKGDNKTSIEIDQTVMSYFYETGLSPLGSLYGESDKIRLCVYGSAANDCSCLTLYSDLLERSFILFTSNKSVPVRINVSSLESKSVFNKLNDLPHDKDNTVSVNMMNKNNIDYFFLSIEVSTSRKKYLLNINVADSLMNLPEAFEVILNLIPHHEMLEEFMYAH